MTYNLGWREHYQEPVYLSISRKKILPRETYCNVMAELNVTTPNIPIITCHELYLQFVLKMHSSFQFLGSVKLLMAFLVFICHLSKLTFFCSFCLDNYLTFY